MMMRMRQEAKRIEARSEVNHLALNQNQMTRIDFLESRLDTRWCVTELGEVKAAVACINKKQCVTLFERQRNIPQP